MIQPDGQTASLLVEWRRGFLLLVSSNELGVVCGGEEQNDENVLGMSRSIL